jgi:hypothetical protein
MQQKRGSVFSIDGAQLRRKRRRPLAIAVQTIGNRPTRRGRHGDIQPCIPSAGSGGANALRHLPRGCSARWACGRAGVRPSAAYGFRTTSRVLSPFRFLSSSPILCAPSVLPSPLFFRWRVRGTADRRAILSGLPILSLLLSLLSALRLSAISMTMSGRRLTGDCWECPVGC